jgi:hypothetical protein
MTKTKEKTKVFHLVYYVDNCSPKAKLFKIKKSATDFIKNFQKKYPNPDDGYWVDFLVSEIHGKIEYFDDYWVA